MSTTIQVTRPTVSVEPVIEPITLTEAKKQCELSLTDSAHDDQLTLLIQAAREQWEHDTDCSVISQTLYVHADCFGDKIPLPRRPISSITSIQYYDSANALQTLSSSIYTLNPSARCIELKYLQTWPDFVDRWDAVKVTYVAGYASASAVPAIHKQAMLLLVGHYFENRDMLMSDAITSVRAYESLVKKFMRSSYP